MSAGADAALGGAGNAAIGFRFKDQALLREALTHGSALDGAPKKARSYDRLEFLGDRVLGLIVAETLLLEAHADEDEGETGAALQRAWSTATPARARRGAPAWAMPSFSPPPRRRKAGAARKRSWPTCANR